MTHWKQLANYDYLGAYSLNDKKEMTVTIKKVVQELVTVNAGRKENCIVAYFSDSDKPMILNKTNCKTITKLHGTPNIEEWQGKKITLFASTASLAGETVECLRIRPYVAADKTEPLPEITLEQALQLKTAKGTPLGELTREQLEILRNSPVSAQLKAAANLIANEADKLKENN